MNKKDYYNTEINENIIIENIELNDTEIHNYDTNYNYESPNEEETEDNIVIECAPK